MDNSHIQWAINTLSEQGYQFHAPVPEMIQYTPWSEIWRFETNQGFIFLKKMPPALSIESRVIHVLHKEFAANVPKIIAENQENNCFLMQDAGMRLYDYCKNNFQIDILIQVIRDYAALQIATSGKVKIFLDMGVPDWRLEKLPILYRELISHEILLLDDGLSKDELIKLKELESKLGATCGALSRYEIKEAFGHADFHDKNILINIDTHQTTFIDLGEVVVTHPFFSFLNYIHRVKENFLLSDVQYRQLQLAYFKPWSLFDAEEHLFEILDVIQQCWSIHAVLGEFRLMRSVDSSAFQQLRRQGRLAKNLRYWLACAS